MQHLEPEDHGRAPGEPAQCPRPRAKRPCGRRGPGPWKGAGLAGAVAWIPAAALAHAGPAHPPTLVGAWTPAPWLLLPLAAWILLYARGLLRLRARAGARDAVRPAAVAAAASGVVVLLLATTWPLDAFGDWSLAAHVAQHMLLIAFVPPLLLAGQPMAVAAHALPAGWARAVHRAFGAISARATGSLLAAAVAHGAALCAWHVPSATTLAVENEPVHWAMHASFLASGLWLWAAMWRRLRDPRVGAGAGVVAMVAVMMQMGFLGALLTFASRPLYAIYAERAPRLGLDALADQQLAGVLMWVPSCLPYLAGAMWLLAQGFARLARRSR